MRDTDRYRGCLIGGAVGDALGYAVEFWDEGQIFSRYGKKGITEYAMTDGAARISDDTQLTHIRTDKRRPGRGAFCIGEDGAGKARGYAAATDLCLTEAGPDTHFQKENVKSVDKRRSFWYNTL